MILNFDVRALCIAPTENPEFEGTTTTPTTFFGYLVNTPSSSLTTPGSNKII